jgi:lysyl-tRNA synthetase class 2
MVSGSLEGFRRRHEALWAIRSFFVSRGFWEVDTPQLVPGPGLEPHIDPLAVDVKLGFEGERARRFLITSPELALKRVLAAGAQRVFQIVHVFRDGERGKRHLPEFTMLEWYRSPGTLDDLIVDMEELFVDVALALGVVPPPAPFERVQLAELFRRYADSDIPSDEREFLLTMDQKIEPNLGKERPTVVSRWPASMAILARKCKDDPRFAERFEIYAGGLELCNAFDELTDPVEQRARFVADNEKRRALGKPELPLDEEFLTALGKLPQSAGCALGVDRLLMVLLGATSIDDVTALPWR